MHIFWDILGRIYFGTFSKKFEYNIENFSKNENRKIVFFIGFRTLCIFYRNLATFEGRVICISLTRTGPIPVEMCQFARIPMTRLNLYHIISRLAVQKGRFVRQKIQLSSKFKIHLNLVKFAG